MLDLSPQLCMGAALSTIMAFLGDLKPRLVAITKPPTQREEVSMSAQLFPNNHKEA